VVEQFLNHIQRHSLCKTSDKILLAVSGGLDSMAMLHLFRLAGFKVGVAHCNFQLRGEDSVADEALVNQTCVTLGIPFHVKRFETARIAENEKKSIQVLARELRYDFFKDIAQKHDYRAIATAHHLNDSLETVLLNLVRGTGIEGLTGIPLKNGNVIRPLLFASRQVIKDYADSHGLEWREDESNATDDYNRNFLRHQVVPRLRELNPNLENTFQDTLERIVGINNLSAKALENIKQDTWRETEGRVYINKARISKNSYPQVVLWEFLKSYGFNFDQCKLIMENHQSGRKFYGEKAALTIDREDFILEDFSEEKAIFCRIESGQRRVSTEGRNLNLIEKKAVDHLLERNSAMAQLDADKLKFPLIWRSWKPGDQMIPLGMSSGKKISDMLIDSKVPLPDKRNVTVVESSGEIVWLVGYRIHEAYKITQSTQRVMIIETE
jgi:tRNA(Ile)-lysidine synthase